MGTLPNAQQRPSDTMDKHAPPTNGTEPEAGSKAGRAPEERLLTTGEMARLSNSTLRTVRFYEEEGILRPAKRTEGGHRLFRRSELDRLLFVSDLRTAGLSLEDIKEILELKKTSASGPEAAAQVRRILSVRIDELKEKVAVLARLREEFARTNEIVEACLTCNDHEAFPDGCGDCTKMTQQSNLPRSARVVWAVGSSQPALSGNGGSKGDGSKGGLGPNTRL